MLFLLISMAQRSASDEIGLPDTQALKPRCLYFQLDSVTQSHGTDLRDIRHATLFKTPVRNRCVLRVEQAASKIRDLSLVQLRLTQEREQQQTLARAEPTSNERQLAPRELDIEIQLETRILIGTTFDRGKAIILDSQRCGIPGDCTVDVDLIE